MVVVVVLIIVVVVVVVFVELDTFGRLASLAHRIDDAHALTPIDLHTLRGAHEVELPQVIHGDHFGR